MTPEERELELRRRLAAYVGRQTARATDYDRLVAASAGAPGVNGPAPQPVGPDLVTTLPSRGDGSPAVTVVVPIHEAPDELRACLWSLLRYTTRAATLLLIDDASADPRVDDVLAWAAGLEHVRILRNVQNLGFPATVNRALRASTTDVVLLNSDTEVGPRWLEQLIVAAYADPSTGTVTPLADNAGAFSAPQIDAANVTPARLALEDVARLVAVEARGVRPRSPTGNGFCLYLRRSLINAVGELDAVSFPLGYGEETDYCMRAGRLGWQHVVDDRTFIHHRRAASFGEARSTLVAAARRRMAELHPDYKAKVDEFVAGEDMRTARARVAVALARGEREGAPRSRLLFVVHEGGGGAVATNRDLMGALAGEYECYCFSSDRHVLSLRRIEGSSTELIEQWRLERPLLLGDVTRSDYRAAFTEALDRTAPELVHIRHLFKHTLDAPRLAAARELPTLMSFHDHYLICPTIHLLDERGRYCGGVCTPGAGTCPTVRAGSLPPLKHAFVHQWREEVEAALAGVDAFVTTSNYTREIHRRLLGAVRSRPFELIEHGRDLTQLRGLSPAPEAGAAVRILVAGHLDRHKGADLLAAMSRLDRGRRLELHFIGEVPERYHRLGIVHGAYRRDELADRVRDIQPAFVGVFSVTGESYSHTITEAWAAGVPVLATDLGAQAERVRAHGGGFVISSTDPAAALAQVLAAADDRPAYERERARAGIEGLPSVWRMASRYGDLYREVIDRRRPFAAPGERRTSPLARGLWRLAATPVSPGSLLARRLTHPSLQWKLRASVCPEASELDPDVDLVLVPLGALAASQAHSLVARLSAQETPLVLTDDRMPDPGDANAGADDALLAACRLVIVPSAELARIYSRRNGAVLVVPPALDERLFLDADAHGPPPAPALGAGDTVRLAYIDPSPGAVELELLRMVLERLAAAGGRRYELDVATCWESDPGTAGWYRPVRVADPRRSYDEYARRLRELRAQWHATLVPRADPAECDLRYLESAALGLPGVYSAAEEDRAIQDEVEGLVCENQVGAWCAAIERLASEPALAEAVREGAWRKLTGGRLMRQGAAPLLDGIGRALVAPGQPTVLQHAG